MSALPEIPHEMSEVEYLEFERKSEAKHEYARGEVFAMAGAKREHNLICTSTARHLGNKLADKNCEIYQSDMRVRVSLATSYRYPDIVIVCGQPQFDDDELDVLLNPTILIEVLSKTSNERDRGIKSWEYRQISSLQDYLIISQGSPRIERFQRQEDNTWILSETIGLDSVLKLASIGCKLALADIYEKIEFKEDE